MITRISLENYMSHGRTVIEPASGLTVLVGPNNCGKSAVASALQSICGDHDGDFMVRHGEKSCQVTVETSDGHSVTWRRIRGKVSYVIDGREVHRTGRGNLPDGLDDLLQLAKVRHPNGRDEFDVHFGNQKSPIFLIDREGDAAAFFSTASDAEKLLEVQKLHKEKVAAARRQQRELTQELGRLDGMLSALSPLDEIDVLLGQADEEHGRLVDAEAQAGALELLLKEIAGCESVVGFHARQSEAMAEMSVPPDLEDTSPIESHLRKLREWARRLDEVRERCESLGGLIEPPELEDVGTLMMLGKSLSSARRWAGRLEAEVRSVAGLVEPPGMADVTALSRLVGQMASAAHDASAARGREAALARLAEPPAPQDWQAMLKAVEGLEKATGAGRAFRGTIASLDAEMAVVDEQINQWLWTNPTCPTCGGQTTREALLSGGHIHAAQSVPERGRP